jgi:hypothetical protein
MKSLLANLLLLLALSSLTFGQTPRTGRTYSIRSYNYPERYWRHRDFELHLDPSDASTLFDMDSTFRVVTGLADPTGISFQSINYPDRYLRHRDFIMYLEAPSSSNDTLFRSDATFKVVNSPIGHGFVQFQSVNYPDRMIRHQDFVLKLNPITSGDQLALEDSSFYLTAPNSQ